MAKKEENTVVENKAAESDIEVFENMDNALNTSEAFIEKNLKPILIGLGVVAAIVIGIVCLKNLVFEPREQAAKEMIYKAEQLFAKDSFQLALDGNGEVAGFLEIVDTYGSTDAGNLAKAYAGICYKQLGENEKAIEFLKKFDSDDKMIQPSVYGAIGDCYWDMDDAEKAVANYKKAAAGNNDVLTPFYNKRAALANMSMGKNAEAIALLESIVKEYPQSAEIAEVKKLLEFAKNSK